MSYQAGSDVTTANGVRLISTPLYQIRVSGPASATDKLEQAVSRLDDLFARTDGFTQGGLVLACYREQPLAFDQIVNGKQWSSFGGLYRLEIQQIS
jgi:hypothetical protein